MASAAAVHCDAPQTANRTIRNTPAVGPQRILSFTLASHDGCPASQPDAPAAPERPVDGAARRHRSSDMLAKMLVERRAPRNELETEPVVDHRETARGQRDALAVDAAQARKRVG